MKQRHYSRIDHALRSGLSLDVHCDPSLFRIAQFTRLEESAEGIIPRCYGNARDITLFAVFSRLVHSYVHHVKNYCPERFNPRNTQIPLESFLLQGLHLHGIECEGTIVLEMRTKDHRPVYGTHAPTFQDAYNFIARVRLSVPVQIELGIRRKEIPDFGDSSVHTLSQERVVRGKKKEVYEGERERKYRKRKDDEED